jgi:predicted DNA-binding transcriptional regulator
MHYNGIAKDITVVSGKRYYFDGPFFGLKINVTQNGNDVAIHLEVACDTPVKLNFIAENLKIVKGIDEEIQGSGVLQCEIISPKKPWVGVIYSAENPGDKIEVMDGRINHWA